MCEEIIKEVQTFAEPKFAEWVKPFLSINKGSLPKIEEKVI